MLSLDVAYDVRARLLERLEQDLLGGDFDQTLREKPLSRFVVGVLNPVVGDSAQPGPSVEEATDSPPEEGESTAVGEGADAHPVALSHVRFPRSMGITFAVRPGTTEALKLVVTAARYGKIADTLDDSEDRWERIRVDWTDQLDTTKVGTTTHSVHQGLELRAVVRQPDSDDSVSVTVVLINTNTAPPGNRDAYSWFNPQIVVEGSSGVFTPRRDAVVSAFEDETRSDRLLYRQVKPYAVGHGCAALWTADHSQVRSSFIPRHELLLSDPSGASEVNLSMTHLANCERFGGLRELVTDYEVWVDRIESDSTLSQADQQALSRHVADARTAITRMSSGITLLESDPVVLRAFQLMNRAMAEQRSRQEYHRSGAIGDPPSTSRAQWRPFQIAFILVNLRGLADPTSDDRDIADLLWFPTGGGKTEAYFGLIAIAILLRRLRTPGEGGVSVIMRYTLRLLTLQQYQRASGLICALEYLREHELPGTQPISIGLWVGQASTPNSVREARTALKKIRDGSDLGADSADPVQLRQCPWCGTGLEARDYRITTCMTIHCPNRQCHFASGLPVYIVDEDVYRERPSLLIATVDKFAMMPWKRKVGTLFGTAGATSTGVSHAPPDLIVQDELHLISGPLGTMVGLYEAAFDSACSRPTRPKFVASTATVRRAPEQVRAVFAREARQFPPPGSTYRDSYFAVEAPREVKGSREYAGVLSAGTSQSTLMVRVYASLLQSAAQVTGVDGRDDLYWTLLGYFNSLRVLGGAFIQVVDDVPDQIKVVAGRRGEEARAIGDPREMTSRKSSSEIPQELKILERSRGEEEAADVVLATNMISVGVDIDRLGLMVMMGQPQTSAEYIQATSRVGRRMPGLVITIYNAARSRDLSHYEDFSAYHRMLYRHVEATSATPFAARARDRGLHGVLVAMARLLIPAAAPKTAAGNVADWAEELDECSDRILRRLSALTPGSATPADERLQEAVRQELVTLVEAWSEANLSHYEGWFDKSDGALLVEAAKFQPEHGQHHSPEIPWPTLMSMRDVDKESSLYLVPKKKTAARTVEDEDA